MAQVTVGDGGDVAVDDLSLAAQNESYRYSASSYLNNFQRRTLDASNNVVAGSTVSPALKIVGTTQTFKKFDGGQFITPVVVNLVDPSRLVIGGATSVFESSDRGDDLTNLNAVPNANAMVYGGYQGGVANADVLWVASNNGVYLRTTSGGALTKTAYAGGAAIDIAVDPTNWNKAFVIDKTHIWYTANAGATWVNVTGNYAAAAGAPRPVFSRWR